MQASDAKLLQPPRSTYHVSFEPVFNREFAAGEAGPYRALFSDLALELQGRLAGEAPATDEVPESGTSTSSTFVSATDDTASGNIAKGSDEVGVVAGGAAGGAPGSENVCENATEIALNVALGPAGYLSTGYDLGWKVMLDNSDLSQSDIGVGKETPQSGATDPAAVRFNPSLLPLLEPCPNSRDKIGDNRGAMLLRSVEGDNSRQKLLKVLGTLIGAAIRTSVKFDLPLAPMVWKQMVGNSIKLDDVRDISMAFVRQTVVRLINTSTPDEYARAFGPNSEIPIRWGLQNSAFGDEVNVSRPEPDNVFGEVDDALTGEPGVTTGDTPAIARVPSVRDLDSDWLDMSEGVWLTGLPLPTMLHRADR